MKAIDLIKEIMAGKMLRLYKSNNSDYHNLYGLSNNFLQYKGLEGFLVSMCDWEVYDPPITFNELEVGDKFAFGSKGEGYIVTKVSVYDGRNTQYGYNHMGGIVLVLNNPVISRK